MPFPLISPIIYFFAKQLCIRCSKFRVFSIWKYFIFYINDEMQTSISNGIDGNAILCSKRNHLPLLASYQRIKSAKMIDFGANFIKSS